jgi:hypothetical protein
VDVDSSLNAETGENDLLFNPTIRTNRPHSSEKGGVASVQICKCYICDVQIFEEFFE